MSSSRAEAVEPQKLKDVRKHVVDVTYRTTHLRAAVNSLQLAGFDAEAKLLTESLQEMEKLETKLQLQEALLQVEHLRQERDELLKAQVKLALENESLKKEFAEKTLQKVLFRTRIVEVKTGHHDEVMSVVAKLTRESEDFQDSSRMSSSSRGEALISYLDECQEDGKIKTVSQPTVIIKMGRAAKIVIGGTAPVIDPTGKRPGVMMQPIGLQMELRPQVATGGEIELDFHVEFNEPVVSDQQINGVNVATIETRAMSSVVKYNPSEQVLVARLTNDRTKSGKPIMLVITETEFVDTLALDEHLSAERLSTEPTSETTVTEAGSNEQRLAPEWKPAESRVQRANYILPAPATAPR